MKTKKLKKLGACKEAILYVQTQKSPTKAWNNCERGDWMLYIAKRMNVNNRKLTMAKAMITKQVEHLMKDQRSKDVLQACFDYANGKITRKELNAAYVAATTAAYDAVDAYDAYDAVDTIDTIYAAAAYATTYTAYAAACAAYAAASNNTVAGGNNTVAVATYAADANAAYTDAVYVTDPKAVHITDPKAVYSYAAYTANAEAAIISSLKKSADICREYLTEEVLSRYKKLR